MIYVTDDLQVTPASTTGQPSPVNSWQWRRNGQSIENAVASTYRLTDADVGQSITVTQTASNLIGKAYAESAAVNPLAFDPIALYRNNEQGAWYDPSDFDRYMTTGPELVTNGDFSNGTTGWTAVDGATMTWFPAGYIRTTEGALFFRHVEKSINVQVGKTYKVSFEIKKLNSGQGRFRISTAQGGIEYLNASVLTVGIYNTIITATSSIMWLALGGAATGADIEWDNISVKELTAISTATMFQDSAGTTPVTAMEQPVGLILDKRKGLVLGSEQKSNGVIGIVGTLASPAIYNTTTGTGSVNRVSFPGEQSFISFSGLTANSIYRMNFSALGGVGLTLRTGNQSNAGVSIFAASSVFVQASALGVITITAAANGTATFTLDSIRELPGNHAFQATSTSRPVLSARYNLLTKTEQFDDVVWTKQANATITANQAIAPDGTLTADLYTCTAIGGNAVLQSGTFGGVVGVSCTLRIKFKYAGTGRWVRFMWSDGGANQCRVWVDTQNGVLGLGNANGTATYVSSSLVALSDGWYELSLVGSQPGATGFFQINGVDGNGSVTTASAALYLWGADLRVTNDAINQPSYQRVNTATDYDSTGFKPYLRFDGTDDWLQTNSVDFTATDKMTVFAGVRKLSTTANQMLSEFGTGDQNGSFYLLLNAVSFGDRFRSQGGAGTSADDPVSVTPPISRILTGIGNISGDSTILRVNGVQVAQNTADQGTGNYGNYPLYIGRRGGTTLPFNGRLYGLIIRGATTKSEAIVKTEQYMAGKTGNQL